MTVSLAPTAVLSAAAAREQRQSAPSNGTTGGNSNDAESQTISLAAFAQASRLPSVASSLHGLLERSGAGDDLVLATVPWLAAALPDSGHVPERQSAFAVQQQQSTTTRSSGSGAGASSDSSASVGGRRLGAAYEYRYDSGSHHHGAPSHGRSASSGSGNGGKGAGLHLLHEHVHSHQHASRASVRTAARVLRAAHLLPATRAVAAAERARARALARSASRRRLAGTDGVNDGSDADASLALVDAAAVPRGARPRAAHKRLLSLLADPFPVFAGEALRFWLDAFNSTDRLAASAAGCALPLTAADIAASAAAAAAGSSSASGAADADLESRFRFRFAASLDRFTLAGIGGLASFRIGRGQRAAWASDARMAPSLAAAMGYIGNATTAVGGLPAECVPAGNGSTASGAASTSLKAAWLHPHDLMIARGYAPLAASALACGRRCVVDFALATAAAMEQMHEAQALALGGDLFDADAHTDDGDAAGGAGDPASDSSASSGRRALSSSESGLRAARRSSSSSNASAATVAAGPDDALQLQEASSTGRRSVRDVGAASARWHDDVDDDAGAGGQPITRIQLSLTRSTMRVHWGGRNDRSSGSAEKDGDDAAAAAAAAAAGAGAARRLLPQSRDWPVWASAWSVSEAAALGQLESQARRMSSRCLAGAAAADAHASDGDGAAPTDGDGGNGDSDSLGSQWDVDTRLVIASDPLQGACHGPSPAAAASTGTGAASSSSTDSGSADAASSVSNTAAQAPAAAAGTLCAPSNALRFAGAVVLFERGGIPLVEKVQRAADAGAVGVIIMDDQAARCSTTAGDGTAQSSGSAATAAAAAGVRGTVPVFTDRCAPGCSQQRGEGWGCRDAAWLWDTADIPAVMVTRAHGQRLLAGMGK